jgi:hypothetical protein
MPTKRRKKSGLSRFSRAKKLAFLKLQIPMVVRNDMTTAELDKWIKHVNFVNSVSGSKKPTLG